MSKAYFKCECGEEKEIFFEVGKKPTPPQCEKCLKTMKRKFNNVGKGTIVPDDIMFASRMMSNQSSKS